MINFYYGYSIVWSLILILYSLGFSNLCKPLDKGLLIFIVISIILSALLGFFQRKKFDYLYLKENPHKTKKITILFILLFITEIMIERNVPILNVMLGQSYNKIGFTGIKGLHMFLSAAAIVYSFYLSYLFSIFKKKNLLLENLVIIMYFILLVQRQNILICLLGFLIFMYCSNRNKNTDIDKSNKRFSKLKKLAAVLSIIILLYGFGVMGNIRYGSSWKWDDTRMIENLGQINNKYPKNISKQFFWSYLYFVSPLVNLNSNVIYDSNNDNFNLYVYEYIPEYIQNKLDYNKEQVYLVVSSLNASTAYVRSYKYYGYAGMYIMFFLYLFITSFIINVCYKKNKNNLMVICMSLSYFYLFTFFENTFTYPTTSIVLLISFILSFKFKLSRGATI